MLKQKNSRNRLDNADTHRLEIYFFQTVFYLVLLNKWFFLFTIKKQISMFNSWFSWIEMEMYKSLKIRL